MKSIVKIGVLAAAICYAGAAFSQAPADAPAGTNGVCKDGTYSQAAHKQGACRGHQGVKEWYAASGGGASAGASTAPATPAAPATAAAPVTAPAPAAPAAPATKSAGYTPPATPAAGGGPGMVWVNTSTNVYHCPSDRWYGKTKQGAYMSEADAKAKGARPDHGKTCQS
jgi:Protein of unknown function (DUF3761)